MDRILTLLQSQVVLAGITFGGVALALIGAFCIVSYRAQPPIRPPGSASQRLQVAVLVVRNILVAALVFGLAFAAVVSIGFRRGSAGAVIGGALGVGVGAGIELTLALSWVWMVLHLRPQRPTRLLAGLIGILLLGPNLLLEPTFEVAALAVAIAVATALGVAAWFVTVLIRWVLIAPVRWVLQKFLKQPHQEPAAAAGDNKRQWSDSSLRFWWDRWVPLKLLWQPGQGPAAAAVASKRWWPDDSLAFWSGTTVLGRWVQGVRALRNPHAPPNWRDHVLRRVPWFWQVIFSQALWLRGLVFLFVIGHLVGLAIKWVIEHAPPLSSPTAAVLLEVVGVALGYTIMSSSFFAALVGTLWYAATRRPRRVAMAALQGYNPLARFPASLIPQNNQAALKLAVELFLAAVCGLLVAVVSGVTFGPVAGLVNGRTVGIVERIVAFLCTVFGTSALALARQDTEAGASAIRAGAVGVVFLLGGIAIEGIQYFVAPR
jgi:hypothetical protein